MLFGSVSCASHKCFDCKRRVALLMLHSTTTTTFHRLMSSQLFVLPLDEAGCYCCCCCCCCAADRHTAGSPLGKTLAFRCRVCAVCSLKSVKVCALTRASEWVSVVLCARVCVCVCAQQCAVYELDALARACLLCVAQCNSRAAYTLMQPERTRARRLRLACQLARSNAHASAN